MGDNAESIKAILETLRKLVGHIRDNQIDIGTLRLLMIAHGAFTPSEWESSRKIASETYADLVRRAGQAPSEIVDELLLKFQGPKQ